MRRYLLSLIAVGLWPTLTFAQISTQVVEYYHTDALGSVRAVTKVVNGQTQVVSRHDYKPFGEEVAPQNPPVDKRLFTGKERDAETGWDYFGARYAAATIGRFATVDPLFTWKMNLVNPQRWNRYVYGLNNPLRYVDQQGQWGKDVHQQLTEALALAVGFSRQAARQIADADQGVDDNARTGFGQAAHHFASERQRSDAWNKFSRSGNLRDLGYYLHLQQDSYSHSTYGSSLIDPLVHLLLGKRVDRTADRPDDANAAAEDTYGKLFTAIGRTGDAEYSAVPWEQIQELIANFNSAESELQKERILDNIRTTIDKYQRKHRKPPR
jgi:RHS repeat-associated protein